MIAKSSKFRRLCQRNHVERMAKTPHEQLLAIFDVIDIWFRDDKFFGCMFINAIGEYADSKSKIRASCIQFKQRMRSYIEKIVANTVASENNNNLALANEIFILLEGATVIAQVFSQPRIASQAKQAAQKLIRHSLATIINP